MVLGVVPIEDRGNVGGGDVSELHAEKFHRDVPQNLPAGRARDGDGIAAKAQFREVHGVLAEDVVAHPHVGETPPCEGVGCDWWCGSHCWLPLWPLHVRVETRHVHAERHLAKAGVASVKGSGYLPPAARRRARFYRVIFAQQKLWGNPLTRAIGAEPLSEVCFPDWRAQHADISGRRCGQEQACCGGWRKTHIGWRQGGVQLLPQLLRIAG